MSREIPEPIRASVGLAATVLDDVRSLPRTLPGLPVRLIGIALQAAMKLQQQWSGLVARGDEVLTGIRGASEPGLATFDDDDDEAAAPDRAQDGSALVAQPIDVLRDSAFDRAPDVDTTAGTTADEEVAALPDDPAADAVVAAVEDTASALDDTDARVEFTEVDVMEVDVDTDAAGLVDDEAAGLPPDPAPAEVVAALEGITDQVQGAEEAQAALDAADSTLTAEDALESALLEAEGTGPESGAATPDDAPAASDPGGSPVGELAGAPDVGSDDTATPDAADSGVPDTDIGLADAATGAATDEATGEAAGGEATAGDAGVLAQDAQPDAGGEAPSEVDVITPDGEVATVEGTVTEEGVVAPEGGEATAGPDTPTGESPTGEDTATGEGSDVVTEEHVRVDEEMGAEAGPAEDAATTTTPDTDSTTDTDTVTATDEGGTPVAAAGAAPEQSDAATDDATDDAGDGSEGSGAEAAGSAPIEGYDSFTIAQLRGRLRGYQLATVQDLLAYEEATQNRPQFVTMLRNRLEKLEQQAVDASPLQPRG
ncbi:hypothetical protein SAMN05660464_2680 [Geodermatophilus dictyosporus]|uniref:Lipid droplet-associated protein n=1 Tax=Geodermatophilus dictyosporus TaxID=1523247 RepID=A0A1I5NT67_9ACTN|nr:hypothetical protein [Geodermatophilus dictyosporus]SFP24972.1 hypothetical protein SAMN05660464_2680 [Geodermatophilus dictyosporus]